MAQALAHSRSCKPYQKQPYRDINVSTCAPRVRFAVLADLSSKRRRLAENRNTY